MKGRGWGLQGQWQQLWHLSLLPGVLESGLMGWRASHLSEVLPSAGHGLDRGKFLEESALGTQLL